MKHIKLNKKTLISIGAAALLLAMFVGAGGILAQTGTGTASSAPVQDAPAVPAGFTVIPPNDLDRSDDQIIQLNNLTIRKVSGTLPGTIYASQDPANTCREYFSVDGGTSRLYPCPLAPSVLYQLQVQPDTILLLKDRSRASINDFEVGDRVNVFGFLDRGTSYLQALIVRDLDKPAVAQYIQLNDLTLISSPGAGIPPATIRAARKGPEPCLSFAASARGLAYPCPVGVEISTLKASGSVPAGDADSSAAGTQPAMEVTDEAYAEIYRPFREYYEIRIAAGTRLLNLHRQAIRLDDLRSGDHINVYGRYIPGSRAIEAIILRDLSIPRTAAQATLTVTVCAETPCGRVDGVRVDIHTLIGGDALHRVASQVTVNGQAVFRGLEPGRYTVTATGSELPTTGQQVSLAAGEAKAILIVLGKSGAEDAPEISSIRPASGYHGTKVSLEGRNFASENHVYMGQYHVGSVRSLGGDGETLVFSVPEYVSPCPYDPFDPAQEQLACIAIALRLPPGNYPVYVRNQDGTSNSVNFTLLEGFASPTGGITW